MLKQTFTFTELCDVYSVLSPADRVAMVTDDVFLTAVQNKCVVLMWCHFLWRAAVVLIAGVNHELMSSACEVHSTGVTAGPVWVHSQDRSLHSIWNNIYSTKKHKISWWSVIKITNTSSNLAIFQSFCLYSFVCALEDACSLGVWLITAVLLSLIR